jgi:hypothetical protein
VDNDAQDVGPSTLPGRSVGSHFLVDRMFIGLRSIIEAPLRAWPL